MESNNEARMAFATEGKEDGLLAFKERAKQYMRGAVRLVVS